MILTEIERKQIAYYFHEEDYTIQDLSIMYHSNGAKIMKCIREYGEWYE